MNRKFSLAIIAAGLIASTFAALPSFAHGDPAHGVNVTNPLAADVRAANERFADVNIAIKEGYAPIPCVSAATSSSFMPKRFSRVSRKYALSPSWSRL